VWQSYYNTNYIEIKHVHNETHGAHKLFATKRKMHPDVFMLEKRIGGKEEKCFMRKVIL